MGVPKRKVLYPKAHPKGCAFLFWRQMPKDKCIVCGKPCVGRFCYKHICEALERSQILYEVERQRALVNVSPEVLKQWPEWATAIALRIADESPFTEDKALLITVLTDCFLASLHVAHRLIGTGIIESGYLSEPV